MWQHSALLSFNSLFSSVIHNLLFPLFPLLLMRTRTGRIWEQFFCLSFFSPFCLRFHKYDNIQQMRYDKFQLKLKSPFFMILKLFFFQRAIKLIIRANFHDGLLMTDCQMNCTCSMAAYISQRRKGGMECVKHCLIQRMQNYSVLYVISFLKLHWIYLTEVDWLEIDQHSYIWEKQSVMLHWSSVFFDK